MSGDRRKEIVRHLSEDDLDRLLAETDNKKVSKRLTFVKRLYKGATLEDAADDVGRSSATATRWVRRWNEGGLGLLTPNFGGGSPRNSATTNRINCSNSYERVSPGNYKRSSIFSTRSSTLSTIQSTSEDSSKSSVFHVRFHEHSAPPPQPENAEETLE